MKIWKKYGFIGAGIGGFALILLRLSLKFFYEQTNRIIPIGDDLNLLIVAVALIAMMILGFVVGASVGWVYEKKKAR